MSLDLELIDYFPDSPGLIPSGCRINGSLVHLAHGEPILIHVAEDNFVTATLTMFVDSLTIKSEEKE